MKPDNKFVVSHAPFWQDGTGLAEKHYNIMAAALPAWPAVVPRQNGDTG